MTTPPTHTRNVWRTVRNIGCAALLLIGLCLIVIVYIQVRIIPGQIAAMTTRQAASTTPSTVPTGIATRIITSTTSVTPTPSPTVTAVTTPSPTSTPTPASVVVAKAGNLRAGPGTTYGVVGSVTQGQTVVLIARDATGEWYQTTDGKWIWRSLLAASPALPQPSPTTPPNTPTPEPSKWRVSTSRSSFDDSLTIMAYVDANAIVDYQYRSYRPKLYVRCMEHRFSVYIDTDIGTDYDINAGGSIVRARFDRNAPVIFYGDSSTDYSVVFIRQARTFANAVMQHKTLLVGYTPYVELPVEATFDLRGAQTALPPILKACP